MIILKLLYYPIGFLLGALLIAVCWIHAFTKSSNNKWIFNMTLDLVGKVAKTMYMVRRFFLK